MALNIAHLRDSLAMAERHLASGNRVVIRQKQLISELAAGGHDIIEARALLARFEELLAFHLADRDRLVAAIKSAEI